MMRFTTMKTKLRKYPSIFLILLLAISSCFLTGCVNQHPKDSKKSSQGESVETMLEITDPKEKQAVLNAKAKVKALSGNPRIVATSPAVADICDKLDLDLVGVPKSSVSKIPSRYKKVKKVGLAMSPDMEIVSSLNPDWILAPSSLETDLKPKFEELKNTDQEFLTVNTEDMKKKEPDIIVRAAHALPDQVTKMFNEDFETNDIWKHFEAVKNKRVYDLTYEYFGMSANFKYKKALSELEKDFYQNTKGTQEVKE